MPFDKCKSYSSVHLDKVLKSDSKKKELDNTLNKNNYEEMYKLGASTIHKKNELNNNTYISKEVKKNKLDNLLENKKIGFIKIDVEGHEKNVIIGASEIIKKNRVFCAHKNKKIAT
jgi:FkbM family methyltransferase